MADRTPRFELDPDGVHVWWYHHCDRIGIQDDGTVAGWLPASADTDEVMLPTGPWRLLSRDPLTVQPSILCTRCGCHGFITDGAWVPA